jgi:hypothetical protein
MNPAECSPASLEGWQQGDCCLGEHWFLVRFAPDKPLTEDSKASAEQGGDVSEAALPGFVILSQTCDVVRSMVERPYLEVAALRSVDSEELEQIKKERKPRFAFIPGLEERLLVADLDLVNTVEKAMLLGLAPVRGCRTDDEIRQFAVCLGRKRNRFAFPDSITEMLRKLQSRLQEKHGKSSEEGQAARWIRQFRLVASPGWNADKFRLHFWILLDDDTPEGAISLIETQFTKWSATFSRPAEVIDISWQVTSLDTMSAREFLQSDPLDLDHLSRGKGSSR